jgi:hypothetical protein
LTEKSGSDRKWEKILLDDQIKEEEMGGTCKMHEETDKCIQSMVRKYKGKSPLPSSGHR